ncbi:class I SAM-dependent methyltransferase [uncultured Roseibium sp.]|uniref:class I SAM-dependent methyltransferase n=1 Tax=uncultured Roseibium sp. TaxID=1936171 RepID=UPI002603B57E|nr:class I SAM-dependent methyltransferase [uncultured Roseibium sp.]
MADYDKNPSPYLQQAFSDNPYRLLEWTVFLEELGQVRGRKVLDLACGDGRLTRVLAHGGAANVLGLDVSNEMLDRAKAQNEAGQPDAFPDIVDYKQVSASDTGFALADPADIVTAMYLFHYANSVEELTAMGRFIGRNLKPGGRFVTYTISPDYDFTDAPDDMERRIGFRYDIVNPPEFALVIKDFAVPIWQWSRQNHEDALRAGGLTDINWHPLKLPADRQDLASDWSWYLDNASCIVMTARKEG